MSQDHKNESQGSHGVHIALTWKWVAMCLVDLLVLLGPIYSM